MDSLTRETEARLAADEFGKGKRDHLSASQKVIEFVKDLIRSFFVCSHFLLWSLYHLELLYSARFHLLMICTRDYKSTTQVCNNTIANFRQSLPR